MLSSGIWQSYPICPGFPSQVFLWFLEPNFKKIKLYELRSKPVVESDLMMTTMMMVVVVVMMMMMPMMVTVVVVEVVMMMINVLPVPE